MFSPWVFVVPGALILMSVSLVWWHFHQWERFRHELTEPRDKDYYRRRLRRRVQTSGMVGVLGVVMILGLLVPGHQFPWLYVFIWIGALLLLAWIVLLALADWVASYQYHTQLRNDLLVNRAVLEAQVRRARQELEKHRSQGPHNGSPPNSHSPDTKEQA